MKLYEKNAAELSEMLRSKKCSAAEICDDVLERIHETEDKIGAYVTAPVSSFPLRKRILGGDIERESR